MNPEIWGPRAWFFLHTVALNYPDKPTNEDINDTKLFIKYFGKVIPCDKCKLNFKKHIIELPLTDKVLKDKKTFIKWMVEMHNKVNIINNKKKVTVKKHLINYNKHYNLKKTQNNTIHYFILIIFIVFVALYIYFYNKK